MTTGKANKKFKIYFGAVAAANARLGLPLRKSLAPVMFLFFLHYLQILVFSVISFCIFLSFITVRFMEF